MLLPTGISENNKKKKIGRDLVKDESWKIYSPVHKTAKQFS